LRLVGGTRQQTALDVGIQADDLPDSKHCCYYRSHQFDELFLSLEMNNNRKPKQASRGSGAVASATNHQQQPNIIAAIPCFNEELFIGS